MIDLKNLSIQEFADGIVKNDKVILSRAITLMESNSEQNRDKAWQILELVLPNAVNSIRIGITGPPGAGKSTFIEAVGKEIDREKRKLAIIAIDPTSKKNKGSILGDKTRMTELSKREHVYIRPGASGEFAGGVSMHTREVMLLLECAGYDTIIVETVGVGQSETAASDLVDILLLLTIAGAGDELQGIKRGIMEMADIIAINKNDGDNIARVKTAKAELMRALELFPLPESGIPPLVESCSAIDGNGIQKIWQGIIAMENQLRSSGYFDIKRTQQLKSWMKELLFEHSVRRISQNKEMQSALHRAQNQIENGNLAALFELRRSLEQA